MKCLKGLSYVVLASAITAGAAREAPAAVTIQNLDFPQSSKNRISAGPDGALWFTIFGATTLGRATPTGSLQLIHLPVTSVPSELASLMELTVGTDGSIWTTAPGRNSVFRLKPDGSVSQYAISGASFPLAITVGDDGNVWFTVLGGVGRLTNSGKITLFKLAGSNGDAGDIANGPDGNLWIAVYAANKIIRLTLDGKVSEFTLPHPGSGPGAICSGLNGDLWFTERTGNRIGRITTNGVITEYELPVPGSQPEQLVQAPDGSVWFTQLGHPRLGRITPQGVLTEFAVPGSIEPFSITVGPDGNLWYTETTGSYLGRVTLAGTPGGPCNPGPTVLCIDDSPGDRRFKVQVEYSTVQGGGFAGSAHAVPLSSVGVDRGGMFWFFSADNPELLVKVLPGCPVNGSRWVFLSGGTNVGLIASVEDTVTGEVHTYYNLDQTPFAPVQDTKALTCTP